MVSSNKNYYEILGLKKDASEADIKKAYRKLAREHHPDMVDESDKTAAEKRFKDINEAYQVLSDPQKKSMYDQYGHAGGGFPGGAKGPYGQGFPGAGGAGGPRGPFTYTYTTSGGPAGGAGASGDFDPFDIFEDFFGFRGYSGRRAPKKGKNLYYELQIDFKDTVFGLEREVNVESGKVKVKIPAGVHSGTEIRFAGKGMPGPGDVPAGDLFLTIRVRLPSQYRRLGNTLGTTVEVDMVQAALGDTVEVWAVDLRSKDGLGKVKVKIPAGTQPGTQIRLRGKGMPIINSSSRGDVIVQVMVKIPKGLSKKQKDILKDYLETIK